MSTISDVTACKALYTDCVRVLPPIMICVLSNGLETRLGAFNATYDYFFEWLKVDSEKEKPDREGIRESGVSISYFVDGLLKKERLIDYIENFIIFDNKKYKIIAKNHQYLGVNEAVESYKARKLKNGKLGVFWHTQGSGKSLSMVFYAHMIQEVLSQLRYPGRLAEEKMNQSTHGVNCHKGIIFSLGVICCAIGMRYEQGKSFSVHETLQLSKEICTSLLDDFKDIKDELSEKNKIIYIIFLR